ncbi:OmpA family protein [Pseudomonas syringae]|uniref:OmpA family protein n=1 Tax=Pseudomonas syringae TaxID=317 RepID=UPI001F30C05B|nr:OmpA family protein [Pseudomonas syringae]MCF5382043.1 OmpA family protein [Pseudomonas syringae]MCF5419423.1 OmpA family protein [Pseudomonas syringae]MCF5451970.1 OmpA family protein [Pseudomonas syringae]MCF5458754.1 OmpA family protein [Pseudomonas syringae]
MNNLKTAAAVIACITMIGCTTNPQTGNFELNRTGLGLAAGAVGGALVGAALGDGPMAIKGALLGAAAGGGGGYLWEKRYRAAQVDLAKTDLQVESAHVENGDQVVVITAPSDVFFRIGSADIAPEAYPALSKLAQSVQAQNYKIGIAGHTDISGSPDLNNKLSYDRARAVAEYLTAAGVPYESLYVRGAGSREPKVNNNTPQNRSINRRVEIVLSAPDAKGLARAGSQVTSNGGSQRSDLLMPSTSRGMRPVYNGAVQ